MSDRKSHYFDDTDNVSFSLDVTSILSDDHLFEVKNGVMLDIPKLRVIPATPIKLESSPESLLNGTSGKIKEVHDTKNEETTENLEKEIIDLKEYLHHYDSQLQKMVLENTKKTEEIEELEKMVAKLESENDLDKTIKKVEAENEGLIISLKKEKEIKEELSKIMKGYEGTLAQLIASKQEETLEYEKEKEKISAERYDAISHLNNLEVAFQDVHLKYEKSKATIEQMQSNENAMKKSLKEYGEIIKNKNDLYEKLKVQANNKLAEANEEISNLTKFNENETLRLKTQIRKAELKMKSLEEALERKKSEVLELSKICEELY